MCEDRQSKKVQNTAIRSDFFQTTHWTRLQFQILCVALYFWSWGKGLHDGDEDVCCPYAWLCSKFHLLFWMSLFSDGYFQERIKLFGAPRQWKHFRPLFQAVFLSGGGSITPQTESNTTPPSPKTEKTYILFYILNFASIIKFKM